MPVIKTTIKLDMPREDSAWPPLSRQDQIPLNNVITPPFNYLDNHKKFRSAQSSLTMDIV